MASSQKLLVTLDAGIKRITINRPERRNSVDTETVELFIGTQPWQQLNASGD